ncbi:hypothetical protein K435DRAFT_807127 [Dendrothele bispora CBS 962.96]|uniref:Uncharacterized protein n=1 Tax=Dendrothele bispora (strain CBS 962.96) TaxID=1314807 RepID=A0A4S8L5P3_DENBC|nr:hypothetical protein K435DRAFT_807127 [Dendrothele bispora CBS 962.96]
MARACTLCGTDLRVRMDPKFRYIDSLFYHGSSSSQLRKSELEEERTEPSKLTREKLEKGFKKKLGKAVQKRSQVVIQKRVERHSVVDTLICPKWIIHASRHFALLPGGRKGTVSKVVLEQIKSKRSQKSSGDTSISNSTAMSGANIKASKGSAELYAVVCKVRIHLLLYVFDDWVLSSKEGESIYHLLGIGIRGVRHSQMLCSLFIEKRERDNHGLGLDCRICVINGRYAFWNSNSNFFKGQRRTSEKQSLSGADRVEDG